MTSSARPPVFVHVGAPKTGTTYLQRKLWHNREALRRDGFCYPGVDWASHVWAALDVRHIRFRGVTDPNVPGAWGRLVRELREFGGPGIVDHELFAGALPGQVERVVRDLSSFAEVHVVYTLRDMARVLPAAWQERMKNREVDTFAQFLEIVHLSPEERKATGNRFWQLNDAPTTLQRWAAHVPADHVHIVTLPPSGGDPALLWNRFAGVLGLDAGRYEETTEGSNSSLSAAGAAVLRRLNEAIGSHEFPWPVYDNTVKNYLANQMAARRGPSIGLPESEHAWALEWSEHVADVVRTGGFDVVGDLAETIPGPWRPGADPDAVPADELAESALDALALLMRYMVGEGNEIWQLRADVADLQRRMRELHDEPPAQRVKRTVVELTDQVGWLAAAYRGYRRLRRRPGPTPAPPAS